MIPFQCEGTSGSSGGQWWHGLVVSARERAGKLDWSSTWSIYLMESCFEWSHDETEKWNETSVWLLVIKGRYIFIMRIEFELIVVINSKNGVEKAWVLMMTVNPQGDWCRRLLHPAWGTYIASFCDRQSSLKGTMTTCFDSWESWASWASFAMIQGGFCLSSTFYDSKKKVCKILKPNANYQPHQTVVITLKTQQQHLKLSHKSNLVWTVLLPLKCFKFWLVLCFPIDHFSLSTHWRFITNVLWFNSWCHTLHLKQIISIQKLPIALAQQATQFWRPSTDAQEICSTDYPPHLLITNYRRHYYTFKSFIIDNSTY